MKTAESPKLTIAGRNPPRPNCGKIVIRRSSNGLRHLESLRPCWPAPEAAENLNVDDVGDLDLTAEEEPAVVAYLRMLTGQ
jgi:hypothetical protein